MLSTEWIVAHDLSLVVSPGGRLWKFRRTGDCQDPLDARRDCGDIVISVDAGVSKGDVEVSVSGDVLEIRGRSDETGELAYDVGLPFATSTEKLQTMYRDGVFEVHVPTGVPLEVPGAHEVPAAVC